MGDILLSKDEIIQSNKRRQPETSISSTSKNSGKSELKKHVTFLPDDSLVQIHEISPRSVKSPDSNDSSDSTDSSSESDSDSETESTSSSETSSEEGAQITRKSQIEVTSARPKTLLTTLKNSLLSKPTSDHKTNKQLSVKLNQSAQANKNEGATNKSRPNILTAAHQKLAKTRSFFTRSNSTLGVSSTAPAKLVNFDNLARRSSIPAKNRPLLPARNAASARRRSEGNVSLVPPAFDSVSYLQTLQTNETFARLSTSLQSLTIEDAFIFPSIQTYDLKLPTLKPHNTISDTHVTLHSEGRNFETSPPKSASGEQKRLKPTLQGNRHSAWQMANGRAEDTLETKPDIAQLWEYTQTWPEF